MIVVVGESLVDLVADGSGGHREHVGGSPLNVAVGLARLEQPCQLITQVGSDERGERVRAYLRENGVEVDGLATADGRTATATAHLDDLGVADYEFDLEWTLPGCTLPAADALHVGSLGTLVEPGRDSVLDLVEQAWARDVTVTYDPNLRPQLIGEADRTWRDVSALAERASVVKLSVEDALLLHPAADPADIALDLLSGERTELVVLTRGEAGASAYAAGLAVEVPAVPTPLVDTVGAGDSFMAGLLVALNERGALSSYGGGMPADEADLVEVVRAASRAAAITCSRPGADPPTRSVLPAEWPR